MMKANTPQERKALYERIEGLVMLIGIDCHSTVEGNLTPVCPICLNPIRTYHNPDRYVCGCRQEEAPTILDTAEHVNLLSDPFGSDAIEYLSETLRWVKEQKEADFTLDIDKEDNEVDKYRLTVCTNDGHRYTATGDAPWEATRRACIQAFPEFAAALGVRW